MNTPIMRLALLPMVLLLAVSRSSAENHFYNYDALGRLKSACTTTLQDSQISKYSLDPAGNRQTYTHDPPEFLIWAGSRIYSADGRFYLAMQTEGNLVLYQASPVVALWATPAETIGSGAGVAFFQPDGNLVLYSSTGWVWQSGSYGHNCSGMQLQNDGNLVIYDTNGTAVWNTGTWGH